LPKFLKIEKGSFLGSAFQYKEHIPKQIKRVDIVDIKGKG